MKINNVFNKNNYKAGNVEAHSGPLTLKPLLVSMCISSMFMLNNLICLVVNGECVHSSKVLKKKVTL